MSPSSDHPESSSSTLELAAAPKDNASQTLTTDTTTASASTPVVATPTPANIAPTVTQTSTIDTAVPGASTPVAATPAPANIAPAVTTETAPPVKSQDPEVQPAIDNIYNFGFTQADRERLVAQAFLFSTFLREKSRTFVRNQPVRILDIGCGPGLLTIILARLYPKAQVIGIDKDASAIAAAKINLAGSSDKARNIEFVVGDVQEKLPEGKFDLIYASVALMYVQQIDKALQMIFDALNPGGYAWLKDVHPDIAHPIEGDATFDRFATITERATNKMGVRLSLSLEMEKRMKDVGFTDLKVAQEIYHFSDKTVQGRIATAMVLGASYNLIRAVSRFENVPEAELYAMHKEVTHRADKLKGSYHLVNTIGQHPLVRG